MGPHFPKTVKVEVAKVEPVASAWIIQKWIRK
jgi:hypothetical protein